MIASPDEQALPPAAGAFALGVMPTPAGGQSKPSEETRKLQQFLKDRGYFKWAVERRRRREEDRGRARALRG